jgi:hypothetical protein
VLSCRGDVEAGLISEDPIAEYLAKSCPLAGFTVVIVAVMQSFLGGSS